MKARPILFKPDMVRAILEGRKTQTRRIVKPLPGAGWRTETATGDTLRLGMITSPHPKKGKFGLFMRREIHPGSGKYEHDLVPCPYGAPGDLLWVREAFSGPWGCRRLKPSEWPVGCPIWYWTDGNVAAFEATPPKPSIHMPRWASRLTLEITDVRVERLQDISEEDAECEGVTPATPPEQTEARHKPAFRHLWEDINGEESWIANPWVWVVEFEPHHMNVDAFLRGREVA